MAVLTLPTGIAPRSATPSLLDFDQTMRPSTGAPALRITRLGSRWQVQIELPAMRGDVANLVLARLRRARRDGLRVPFPLIRQNQGSPGVPVVDGTDSAGTTLKLRGLTPGYMAREGYWLTVTDAAGTLYLHQLDASVRAGADGKATLTVGPMLRCALADGATVMLARPMIEGMVTSSHEWSLPVNCIVPGLTFTIEEAA